ncbi:hypothetical protein Gotur_011695 [Gossypium turneri]
MWLIQAGGASWIETLQLVHREVEIGDAHISSSMQGVYHHFGGHAVTIRIAGGWVHTHRVHSRDTFPKPGDDSTEVERI